MTFFEEILKEIGAAPESEAAEKAAEIVNNFIFSDQKHTDEEIKSFIVDYFKNF